jgi:hypothetical protein
MTTSRRSPMKSALRAGGLVLAGLALASCHRDPSPRIKLKVIEKCEDGAVRAIKQRSPARLQRIYHESCASVFAEPACSDAFFKAGRARVERQDAIALEGCRKAYCPLLASSSLEACTPGFEVTSENATRAWEPLQLAIMRYDARGYSYRLEQTLVGVYAAVHARQAEAEERRAREAVEAAAHADAGKGSGGP